MGAQQSTQMDNITKIESTKHFIDDIAINYIERGTYADMINLTNTQKCQETIILTKDIIKKKMTEMQIDSLHNELYKDKLVEVYVSPILKLQTDNELKCKQIAEHYVLIGNIFNMIKKAFLLNANNKANNSKDVNLCANRLDRIKYENNETDIVNISKNVCSDTTTPDIDELLNLYGHNYKHKNVTDNEKSLHNELNNSIGKSKELISKNKTIFDDKSYEINKTSNLVNEYNKIIYNIENQIEVSQLKLMSILHKLFYYDDDKNIKIRKNIDGVNVETLAKDTVFVVSEMYLTCENEFHKSVDFQEKIHNYKRNNSN